MWSIAHASCVLAILINEAKRKAKCKHPQEQVRAQKEKEHSSSNLHPKFLTDSLEEEMKI